jgi:hypothetical protein
MCVTAMTDTTPRPLNNVITIDDERIKNHLGRVVRQLDFGDGLIAEEVSDLRENWMQHADDVLADEEVIAAVYETLAKRHPKSRCRAGSTR